MVTDVYPMVAEESIVANPQKVVKIDLKNEIKYFIKIKFLFSLSYH